MKLNDAVFGLLLLILGGTIFFTVQSFPKMPGQHVGPALFPGLIAAGLCIGGLILLVRGWKERLSMPLVTPEEWVGSPRHVLAFVLLIGSVVFYLLASEKLGFLLSAVVILLSLFYVLGVPPLRALLIAVVAALVIHFAFYKLLRVPLPWGVLQGIAW